MKKLLIGLLVFSSLLAFSKEEGEWISKFSYYKVSKIIDLSDSEVELLNPRFVVRNRFLDTKGVYSLKPSAKRSLCKRFSLNFNDFYLKYVPGSLETINSKADRRTFRGFSRSSQKGLRIIKSVRCEKIYIN